MLREDEGRDQADPSTSPGMHICKQTTRSKVRGLEQILSQLSEENTSSKNFILDFYPPDLWGNKLQLFQPPSWWVTVQAALEN